MTKRAETTEILAYVACQTFLPFSHLSQSLRRRVVGRVPRRHVLLRHGRRSDVRGHLSLKYND
jgi:hypothetical protein